MSEADIETLRAVYEAVSRGDWDAAQERLPAEFELKTPDTNPIAGTYRGREEVRGFFDDFWAAFTEVVVRPERFVARGDRIVAFLRVQLKPAGSDATVDMRIVHLWTVRDGEILRCEVFTDGDAALEAAGLPERDSHAGA